MGNDLIFKVSEIIVTYLKSKSFKPSELFKEIARASQDPNSFYKRIHVLWGDDGEVDINHPVIISPGWDEIVPQEQLLQFLPEEKLLINKDIFRNRLNGLDLTNIDSMTEKRAVEELVRESIGLSRNDVLLYYNLLKINQISLKSKKTLSKDDILKTNSTYIYSLINDSFSLGLNEEDSVNLISRLLKRNGVNPMALSLAMGRENDKFFNFFKEFLVMFIERRGDDLDSLLRLSALYTLFNGAKEEELSSLGLNANEIAFISDRIGRVRAVYYVLTLFIHTFNLLISAQVYEISTKYWDSGSLQKEKLKKLYMADNRRKLLLTNALNIATRKVSSYKSESAEVLNSFKRFLGKSGFSVEIKDLFERDYRE